MTRPFDGVPSERTPESGAAVKRRLAQALVAAPGIILVLIALSGAFKDYRHVQYQKHRAAARTAAGEATLLETHDYSHGTILRVNGAGTVGFTTPAGKEVRAHIYTGGDRPGKKYPIHYDPDDPENFSLSDQPIGYSSLIGNAPLFVFGAYLLFMAHLLGRRRA
jgi:hypothetical protein